MSSQPFLVFPYKIGQFIPAGSGDIGYLVNVLTSYSLRGKIYSEVAELSHNTFMPTGPFQLIHNDTFYVNFSNWIIKMKLHHPTDTIYNQYRVWELLRYNIIK